MRYFKPTYPSFDIEPSRGISLVGMIHELLTFTILHLQYNIFRMLHLATCHPRSWSFPFLLNSLMTIQESIHDLLKICTRSFKIQTSINLCSAPHLHQASASYAPTIHLINFICYIRAYRHVGFLSSGSI